MRCVEHNGSLLSNPTPEEKEKIDFSFFFNVHTFVSFFGKEFKNLFPEGIKQDPENIKEFFEKWDKFLHEVLEKTFSDEMNKIEENFKKQETHDYIG